MKHISEIIDTLRASGELPHDAPPAGFPCDVGITPEELTPEELDVDEYTREECRQSEFFFMELISQLNAEEAYDERNCFEATHPNAGGRHG
jgi:hypothetical protein